MYSFQAKMNENTLVATRPGATRGKRIRQKIRAGPAPSIAAASSISRGTAATKLRSIQMEIGSAMTSAWHGSICTTSSMIRNEVRNRNRNRATATAASSETSEEAATAVSVTSRLLTKNVQNEMPMALPLSTLWKLAMVGWAGSGCGVSEKISRGGLNAVEIIHTIGARVTTATSTPAALSATARSRLAGARRGAAREASATGGSEPGAAVTAVLPA